MIPLRNAFPPLVLLATASLAGAQPKPSLEELAKPRLPLPITLRYRVVESDIRPLEVRQRQKDEATKREVFRMAQRGESQERIDEYREARRRTPLQDETARYTLTISLTKDSLVYRRQEETQNQRALEFIDTVGNERSYRYQNYRLDSYNGNWEVLMDQVPLPGVGIGPYPLFRLDVKDADLRRTGNDPRLPWADVFSNNSEKGPITYEWGTVFGEMAEGKPRVTRVAVGFANRPHDDWRFSDFRLQDGVWVAGRLVDRTLNGSDPDQSVTYDLLSLERSAGLSAEDTIRLAIKKGDPVREFDGKGKPLREYRYDPEKGDPLGAAPGMGSAMLMGAGGLGALTLLATRLGRRRR